MLAFSSKVFLSVGIAQEPRAQTVLSASLEASILPLLYFYISADTEVSICYEEILACKLAADAALSLGIWAAYLSFGRFLPHVQFNQKISKYSFRSP